MTERITKGLRYIDGVLYIGDGNVTAEVGIGITSGIQIDQGASDDAFIVVKSSDIAHGYTGQADTDTFLYYKKVYATGGGVHMQVMGENSANPVNYIVDSRGGQAETTKSTAGRSLIEFHATQHNGSNAIANVTADGNVFGIRARAGGAWATVFIVDEDGDLWLNGGITAASGKLLVASTASDIMELNSTGSGASGPAISLKHVSASPDAGNNVGIIYSYGLDDAGTPAEVLYGYMQWEATTITAGSEDVTVEWRGIAAGAQNLQMTLTGAGALGADGAFTEFDEYDDHALISVKGHELDRLCEVGVMTKKPLGEDGKVMGSGYMLNLQNAIYLGWGGIKQNRAKIDDLEDRLSRAGI